MQAFDVAVMFVSAIPLRNSTIFNRGTFLIGVFTRKKRELWPKVAKELNALRF
jgi:hypothetical protein